jgi:hypothetical protein
MGGARGHQEVKAAQTEPTPSRPAEARETPQAAGNSHVGPLGTAMSPASGSNPSRRAAIIDRIASFRPSRAAGSLLQLQRQLGNRYVQRVLARASERNSEPGVEVHPQVEASIERARGGGRPIDAGARHQMESAFGTDFGGVRIHTDAEANQLNRELGALAFTTGSDIFFRHSEYNPDSSAGKKLLAHELTHVVQQSGARVQTKLSVSEPDDESEQEAERVAGVVARELESGEIPGSPNAIQKKCACADAPGTTCPSCTQKQSAKSHAATGPESDIPAIGDEETGDIAVETRVMRDGGDGGGGGGATPQSDSCAVPLSMTKVTSGSFQGGLSMDNYYPDLATSGIWARGGSGGPFDTGSSVGSNVQLFGTFPSPCRPDQYTLAQTVTYDKKIVDGVHDPKEGAVQDDIAKSGRDFSKAPARQDFLGNGYDVSMADPPFIRYSASSNIEWDRSFTTSLVGPGGKASVSWSTSIKVESGKVTKNTIS